VSFISTAHVGNYRSGKRVGRPFSISNQKKKRIERSIRDTNSSEKSQLLAHMPKVIRTYRRCACYSKKEREKTKNIIYNFCCIGLYVKNCFFLYHRNYVHQ